MYTGSMSTTTAPTRRRPRVSEPHCTAAFYVPERVLRGVQRLAQERNVSASRVAGEAFSLFLAVNMHNPDMNGTEERKEE